jgi:hypothetical protein
LLRDDSDGRVARELWWTNQEFFSAVIIIIILLWFFMLYITWGMKIDPSVSKIQIYILAPI